MSREKKKEIQNGSSAHKNDGASDVNKQRVATVGPNIQPR